MIANDQELEATFEQIRRTQMKVVHLRRVQKNPDTYRMSSAVFLAEIDRLQLDVRIYLQQPPMEMGAG